MAVLTPALRLRRWLIRSQWTRWIFPTICSLPYLASVLWLMLRGQGWIAQVLLAPLLMGAVMALLTLCLARQEFRGRWRPR
jgi:hypothetical protein